MTKMFDFVKFLKKSLIISGSIMLIGILVVCIFGVNFDITFVGGSRFTYSYVGEVDTDPVSAVIKDNMGIDSTIAKSANYNNDSQKLVMTFSGDITSQISDEVLKNYEIVEENASSNTSSTTSSVTSETTSKTTSSNTSSTTSSTTSDTTNNTTTEKAPENTEKMVLIKNALAKILNDNFKDNQFSFNESNIVNPTLAGSFLFKSLFAVVIAAALVIIYIGIRFRKIGGLSAGISALIALIHDVLVAFFVCAIFRLDIDANFFAVALTLFGYSINDTIVIFDRVRENKKYYPSLSVREQVNKSVNETLMRSIMTSVATFAAIMAVVVVAEFFGVTTLRSFAIPMAVGVVSGCYTTVFLSGPIWVKWNEARAAKKTKK